MVLDVRVNECYTNQEIADLVVQAPCEVTAALATAIFLNKQQTIR